MKMTDNIKQIILLGIVAISFLSCKKFLEIDPPSQSLVPATVFKNDEIATSALLGIYSTMGTNGYASGDMSSISVLCGLAADEYVGYNPLVIPYQTAQLTPENPYIITMWSAMYNKIYAANSILEGLEGSSSLTNAVKDKLKGEALFIRAFHYFYLVNLFGPVPMHLGTDIATNQRATKATVSEIYGQLINDLQVAETLLDENYPTVERIRPNRAAVQALLARIFLFQNDLPSAESYVSKVIAQQNRYELVALDNVFLKNSREAIWQLMPPPNTNTSDGNLLILTAVPAWVALDVNFVQTGFESGDQRKASWIRRFTNPAGSYDYPFKYKIKTSATVTEYSMVLRLAEQYLIRAEVRAKGDQLEDSIRDLNFIRRRAGLADLSVHLNKMEVLAAVEKERRCELFSEWGHRWLDLKRSGRANAVLAPIKPNWKTTSVLFPISSEEVNRNSNVKQNEGY